MFRRVRYLFVKELIQALRDKRMRITLIVPPIFQLIVFGYAANLDVKHIRTAVRDLDQSVDSRDLIGRFGSSKYFDIVAFPQTPKDVKDLIDRGEVAAQHRDPQRFFEEAEKRRYGDGSDRRRWNRLEYDPDRPGLCGPDPFEYSTDDSGEETESGQESSALRRPESTWSTGPGSIPILKAGSSMSRP